MRPRIKKIKLPAGRRILAVSDIHGNLPYFRGLLEKVGFSASDVLVIVGDMCERGPDSLGTLRYIMGLCRDYTVMPVLGNCDEWNRAVSETEPWNENYVRTYMTENGFGYPVLLEQMCAEIGFEVRVEMDMALLRRTLRERFREEFSFLESLPHMIETEHYTFVHGGIPEGDPETWDSWACMKNDYFLRQGRHFEKWVIVGHTPVLLYGNGIACMNPIIEPESRIISIDGGCSLEDFGQLNALIIPHDGSEAFSHVAYDSFPVGVALEAQPESPRSEYIRWGDNRIEVLIPGEEFSYCRHIRTGYEMDILTNYIYERDEAFYCNDFTDYVLPLSAGDRVRIIEETGRGAFVKRLGTVGWYRGKLERR